MWNRILWLLLARIFLVEEQIITPMFFYSFGHSLHFVVPITPARKRNNINSIWSYRVSCLASVAEFRYCYLFSGGKKSLHLMPMKSAFDLSSLWHLWYMIENLFLFAHQTLPATNNIPSSYKTSIIWKTNRKSYMNRQGRLD